MSNIDRSHLNALETHLSHERTRLANAKSEYEKRMRAVWLAQLEKEIAGEKVFLGIEETEEAPLNLSDAELLAQLLND